MGEEIVNNILGVLKEVAKTHQDAMEKINKNFISVEETFVYMHKNLQASFKAVGDRMNLLEHRISILESQTPITRQICH